MWVCTSTAPGRTYLPEASITWASGADSPAPTAFTTPSSRSRSARKAAVSLTMVPF